MAFSEKQCEYFKSATHRWNIKVGATRSGKTYCDFFTIPKRIRAAKGDGLIVLIGNTVGTLCRNILDPMREIWGDMLVGMPASNSSSVMLFGKKCYLMGASNSSGIARLQGASVEYAYGDEITTWNEDVFAMLKSRLDKPSSRFDGTCNPSVPTHWFKRFLDSSADIFLQTYTIDDNPFLSPVFVRELKKEYEGTVYYDRYIRGLWCAAEGAIYSRFAANPSAFLIGRDEVLSSGLSKVVIGVDFGGTKSATAFVAVGIVGNFDRVVALSSETHSGEIDGDGLCDLFCNFCEHVRSVYGSAPVAYCDNAESVLIRTLKKAAAANALPVSVRPAQKIRINDRIRLVTRLMASERFFLTPDCKTLSDALASAVWNPDSGKDERLDNGTGDVDSLDALEYCIERDIRKLI